MNKATRIFVWVFAGMLLFGSASFAQGAVQSTAQDVVQSTQDKSGSMTKLAAGQKVKMSGLIVERNADNFILRTGSGETVTVSLTSATEIKEKKSNPFRGARKFASSDLVRGLAVEVEGLGDASGALAARDVKFTQTEYKIANSVESRVTPVESRLGETEGRLTKSEQNAQHLSGQVEELREISNAARGGAKAAQDTADSAVAGVSAANERITSVDNTTNARITAVDEYEVKDTAMVHFKVGSAVLSEDAKNKLDGLISQAQAQKGYVIEVTGFASSDGNPSYNRNLSKRRADAVVQYLADQMIPLRRIVTPFGFGEQMPIADNDTRTGRQENRRVEVKILTSKGLANGQHPSAAARIDK